MGKKTGVPRLKVVQLSAETVDDFFQLHSIEYGCGWCYCVAWWTPSWQGWGERTAEDNYNLRMELFNQGHYDGYLAYVGGEPVGWCQAGRRNRLEKLNDQFDLQESASDSEIWSITCFLVSPEWRRKRVAATMLGKVLDDLRKRGVTTVEAYPKRGEDQDELDLWNGAEAMYLQAGFEVIKDDDERPILRKRLK